MLKEIIIVLAIFGLTYKKQRLMKVCTKVKYTIQKNIKPSNIDCFIFLKNTTNKKGVT